MIKEQVNIVVELKDSVESSQITDIKNAIESQPGVIASSIHYLNSNNANDILGDDVLSIFTSTESPFKDMVTFRLNAENYNNQNLALIDKVLMKDERVNDVFFESESDIGIHDLIQKLSLVFLVLSLIFVGLALIIIHNTLSLSLYADRWEIKTMELVGARKSFIRKPYVAHGRIIGQRAFFLAAAAFLMTVLVLYLSFDFVNDLIYWPYIVATLVILFVLSTVITMISTFSVVNKFLEQKLSDLYA